MSLIGDIVSGIGALIRGFVQLCVIAAVVGFILLIAVAFFAGIAELILSI